MVGLFPSRVVSWVFGGSRKPRSSLHSQKRGKHKMNNYRKGKLSTTPTTYYDVYHLGGGVLVAFRLLDHFFSELGSGAEGNPPAEVEGINRLFWWTAVGGEKRLAAAGAGAAVAVMKGSAEWVCLGIAFLVVVAEERD
eukprot:49738_1